MKTIVNVPHREIPDACVTALRYVGLWSSQPDSSLIFKLFYTIYNKLAIGLICTFTATIFADLCLNYGDLMIVTDDGCYLAGISLIIYKLFIFQIRRRKIENLINVVHNTVETLQRSSDSMVVMLVKSFVFYEKITIYCLGFISFILMIALIFFVPTENGSLPVRAKYPFDTTVQPMHSIAFVIQTYAVSVGLLANVTMDAIIRGFCSYTRLQLQVLSSNFHNCQISTSVRSSLVRSMEDLSPSFSKREVNFEIRSFVSFDSKEVNVIDDSFVKRFKTCIKRHQCLIKVVKSINEIFSSSMLFQLCASSFMICLTGFQAALGAKESASLMKFALFLGAAFAQLMCFCWYGNTLIYQSDSLSGSPWFSGWEHEQDFSAVSVLILVSLIRMRKPMQLTAGKFFTMSMETFITILRSSYSFFALLTNVNDEE